MKKLFPAILIVLLAVGGYYFVNRTPESSTVDMIDEVLDREPTPTPFKTIDYTASFEIYTHGTKRIFTNAMYHDLSSEIFINEQDPSIVHVKKTEATWADFFETLPMKLTKECLVTGTNQTFCTNEGNKLRFYIDDVENPNALMQVIGEGEKLVVTYGS